jgi:NAD(P)H-quinone oxidoreductase subunit 5
MNAIAWSVAPAVLAAAVPLLLAVGAAVVSRRAPLATAGLVTRLSLGLALAALAAHALAPHGAGSALAPIVRVDGASSLALALVTALGLVVARFSRRYLAGGPGLFEYARALLATLAAVSIVVVTGHLAIALAAFAAKSVALHRLIRYRPDRPRAASLGREKRVLDRAADLAGLVALALVAHAAGTLDLAALASFGRAVGRLPVEAELGVTLLAVAVALRSAQLPFHGWMTRVMELPTPVSALLHAGVVNLGGYLLLRVAPLVDAAPLARAALVAVGASTAVVGVLAMATRPTAKTTLAWSTIAQMGFLLVECGLGAWSLALVHLVVHSLYKAHAFLRAGSAAAVAERRALVRTEPTTMRRELAGIALTLGALAASIAVIGPAHLATPTAGLSIAHAIGLAPLVARGLAHGPLGAAIAVGAAAALGCAHVVAHALVVVLAAPPASSPPPLVACATLAGALVALRVGEAALAARPDGALAAWIREAIEPRLPLDAPVARAAAPPHAPAAPTREPSAARVVTTEEVGSW